MSVLSRPRIHFSGFTDWSPSTANNAPNTYDEGGVEPFLQKGVTYNSYLDWLKKRNPQMLQPNGSWNVYGDHGTRFAESKVFKAELGTGSAAGDPLIGSGVDLLGLNYSDGAAPARLVMTDPFTGGEATSQIFYQWLVVGNLSGPQDQWIGCKAAAATRMFSRWPYQTRNLGITFKEGMVGCIWQAASLNKDTQWFGLDKSPALAALKAAAESESNQGILMRFASYRTLYYQACFHKGKRIENGLELVAAYHDGFTGDNPARSTMLGTVGVWEAGELASAPAGRLLVPQSAAQLATSPATASLGPAVAKVDAARNVLVVDFITTFPEQSAQLDKADFGDLQLQARDVAGNITPIATLTAATYNQQAYEASGGISEFPLPPGTASSLGTIELIQQQANQPIAVLQQTAYTADTDDWAVYIDEAQAVPVCVSVYEDGGPVHGDVKLFLQQYDSDGNLMTKPMVKVLDAAGKPIRKNMVPVVAGKSNIVLRSLIPGACFLAFYPFTGVQPPDIPGAAFPLPDSFYVAIRALPFDNELEKETKDNELTWSFIFSKVLRVFSLVYPVMSLVRNLGDRNVVEAMADQLKFAISLETFESTLYMPITRDLSAGKRRLLQRWVNLLPNPPEDKP
ncbi:MAG: hypothetical protein ABJF23_04270 [Bryobacteraceae bacterium]